MGFGGYHPPSKSIVFSFRSTVDIINFFEDISFLKVPLAHCKGCEIHFGFYEAWKSIENKILSIYLKLIAAYP